MIQASDVRTAVVSRDGGYAVQVYTGGGTHLWFSAVRLTPGDAKGFESDIQDALSNLACLWCNRPASQIDHLGDLERDVTDISAFCSDRVCVREAGKEAALGY